MSPRAVVNDLFRSLRVRNYRLFTAAQLVSISGTWMQTIGQSWLVLKLTGSGVALGIVTGLQFLPTAMGGLWGGLVADRFDKRKILIATQASAGVLAGILGVLTMTGVVALWHVYVLAFLLGLATAIDTPARQAFVIEMVGPEDVANAVGLNSAVFNTGRIVGPALAAIVIKVFGLATAFHINALTYAMPVIALTMMDPRALFHTDRPVREKGMVREGLRYSWRAPNIRRALLVLTVVATVGFNFSVTVPLLSTYTFGKDVSAYAILTSMLAGGGLIGALWVAHRARPTDRLMASSATLFGLFAVASAMAPTLWTAAFLLAVTGGASMAFISTVNSTLQLESPAHLRGRVMALYALVFLGSTPIGSPLIGWISEIANPRVAIAAGGAASFVAGGVAMLTMGPSRWASRMRRLRPSTDVVVPKEATQLILDEPEAIATRAN